MPLFGLHLVKNFPSGAFTMEGFLGASDTCLIRWALGDTTTPSVMVAWQARGGLNVRRKGPVRVCYRSIRPTHIGSPIMVIPPSFSSPTIIRLEASPDKTQAGPLRIFIRRLSIVVTITTCLADFSPSFHSPLSGTVNLF